MDRIFGRASIVTQATYKRKKSVTSRHTIQPGPSDTRSRKTQRSMKGESLLPDEKGGLLGWMKNPKGDPRNVADSGIYDPGDSSTVQGRLDGEDEIDYHARKFSEMNMRNTRSRTSRTGGRSRGMALGLSQLDLESLKGVNLKSTKKSKIENSKDLEVTIPQETSSNEAGTPMTPHRAVEILVTESDFNNLLNSKNSKNSQKKGSVDIGSMDDEASPLTEVYDRDRGISQNLTDFLGENDMDMDNSPLRPHRGNIGGFDSMRPGQKGASAWMMNSGIDDDTGKVNLGDINANHSRSGFGLSNASRIDSMTPEVSDDVTAKRTEAYSQFLSQSEIENLKQSNFVKKSKTEDIDVCEIDVGGAKESLEKSMWPALNWMKKKVKPSDLGGNAGDSSIFDSTLSMASEKMKQVSVASEDASDLAKKFKKAKKAKMTKMKKGHHRGGSLNLQTYKDTKDSLLGSFVVVAGAQKGQKNQNLDNLENGLELNSDDSDEVPGLPNESLYESMGVDDDPITSKIPKTKKSKKHKKSEESDENIGRSGEIFDSSLFEELGIETTPKKTKKSKKQKKVKKSTEKELELLKNSNNLLESALTELNQFEIEGSQISNSQLFSDFEDIIEGFRDEDDIVVPMDMSGIRREIRQEKKAEAKRLIRQYTRKDKNSPETLNMATIEEEEEEVTTPTHPDYQPINGAAQDQENYEKNRKIEENSKKEILDYEGVKESRIRFEDIDLQSGLVKDIVNKIHIDSSIIKSLVDSRFVGVIKKRGQELMRIQKHREGVEGSMMHGSAAVNSINILNIFNMYSKVVEKKIHDLNHRVFSGGLQLSGDVFSPISSEIKRLRRQGLDFRPFVFSRCEGMNNFCFRMFKRPGGRNGGGRRRHGPNERPETARLTAFQMSRKMIVFGTNEGLLLEIPIKRERVGPQRKLQLYYDYQKAHKYEIRGNVSSVDVSPHNHIWAAGTQEGGLYIRRANGGWGKRLFENVTLSRGPVLQVKWLSDQELIISYLTGISRLFVRDMKLSFDIYTVHIFRNLKDVVNFEILRSHAANVVLTATLDAIFFTSMLEQDSKFLAKIERPRSVERGWSPVFTHFQPEGELYLLVLIFWKSTLHFVKSRKDSVENLLNIRIETRVAWATILRNKIICTIDYQSNLKVEVVERFGVSHGQGVSAEQAEKQSLIFGDGFRTGFGASGRGSNGSGKSGQNGVSGVNGGGNNGNEHPNGSSQANGGQKSDKTGENGQKSTKKKRRKRGKDIRFRGELSIKFDDYSPIFKIQATDEVMKDDISIQPETIKRLKNLNGFIYLNKNGELRQCNLMKIPEIIAYHLNKKHFVNALDTAQSALNHELYCSQEEYRVLDRQIVAIAEGYLDHYFENRVSVKPDVREQNSGFKRLSVFSRGGNGPGVAVSAEKKADLAGNGNLGEEGKGAILSGFTSDRMSEDNSVLSPGSSPMKTRATTAEITQNPTNLENSNFDEKQLIKSKTAGFDASQGTNSTQPNTKKQTDEKNLEKILAIIIEALTLADKEEVIYKVIAVKLLKMNLKFQKFLEVLRVFITKKVIKKIPLQILAKSIELEGFTDINKAFILKTTRAEIQNDLTSFQSLFNHIYENKNALESSSTASRIQIAKKPVDLLMMIRLSLIFPEKCLPYFLNALFEDLRSLGYSKIIDTNIKILSLKQSDYTKESLERDLEFIKFIRVFWFLWMIISWSEKWWSKISDFSQKGRVVMIALEWILQEKNFRLLSEANFQIILEIFYQIFLDYFFMSSTETVSFFKALWKKLKRNLVNNKKNGSNRNSTVNKEKANSVLDPRASYLERIAQEKDDEKRYLPEYMAQKENHPNKEILLCLQSMTPKRFQIDFSYLFVKILNLSSMYEGLLCETQWIKRMISKLLGARFRSGRFWLIFTPLIKRDFEDEIIRILKKLYKSLGTDYLRLISDRAEKNS